MKAGLCEIYCSFVEFISVAFCTFFHKLTGSPQACTATWWTAAAASGAWPLAGTRPSSPPSPPPSTPPRRPSATHRPSATLSGSFRTPVEHSPGRSHWRRDSRRSVRRLTMSCLLELVKSCTLRRISTMLQDWALPRQINFFLQNF